MQYGCDTGRAMTDEEWARARSEDARVSGFYDLLADIDENPQTLPPVDTPGVLARALEGLAKVARELERMWNEPSLSIEYEEEHDTDDGRQEFARLRDQARREAEQLAGMPWK